MEIDKLDRVKLLDVMSVTASHKCDGPKTCHHCKIIKKLHNIPCVREMIEHAVREVNRTDDLCNLEFIFFIGFIVAWEYRDVLELEEVFNRA